MEQANWQRKKLFDLTNIILQLNTRVTPGPYTLSGSSGHEKECLEFLKKYELIHGFHEKQEVDSKGKVIRTDFIVHVQKDDANPAAAPQGLHPALQNIPRWFNGDQRKVLTAILQDHIPAAKPGFVASMDVRLSTPKMQQQVMDYLLLQGVISAWSVGRGIAVYVKINAADRIPNDIPMGVLFDWRESQTVLKERKFQEMNAIRLRPEHLYKFEHSILTREQFCNLGFLVNHLNERVEHGPYSDRSDTAYEMTSLRNLMAEGLIHDFKLEDKSIAGQGIRLDYTIYVTPADLPKNKP